MVSLHVVGELIRVYRKRRGADKVRRLINCQPRMVSENKEVRHIKKICISRIERILPKVF